MPANDPPQPPQPSKAAPPPFVPSPTSTRRIPAGFTPLVSRDGIQQQVCDRLCEVKEALILLGEYEHAATVQDVAIKIIAPPSPVPASPVPASPVPASPFPPLPWRQSPKSQDPFPPGVVYGIAYYPPPVL